MFDSFLANGVDGLRLDTSARDGKRRFEAKTVRDQAVSFKTHGFGMMGKHLGHYAPMGVYALALALCRNRVDDEDYLGRFRSAAVKLGAIVVQEGLGVRDNAAAGIRAAKSGWNDPLARRHVAPARPDQDTPPDADTAIEICVAYVGPTTGGLAVKEMMNQASGDDVPVLPIAMSTELFRDQFRRVAREALSRTDAGWTLSDGLAGAVALKEVGMFGEVSPERSSSARARMRRAVELGVIWREIERGGSEGLSPFQTHQREVLEQTATDDPDQHLARAADRLLLEHWSAVASGSIGGMVGGQNSLDAAYRLMCQEWEPTTDLPDDNDVHAFCWGLALVDCAKGLGVARLSPPGDAVGINTAGERDRPDPDAVVAAKSPVAEHPSSGMKICPDCAEEVRAAARICRFCRFEFEEPSS